MHPILWGLWAWGLFHKWVHRKKEVNVSNVPVGGSVSTDDATVTRVEPTEEDRELEKVLEEKGKL